MQERDERSVTVRVPAERFQELVARVEKLGEVQQRQVKASDITEEMMDLDIRLENAIKTRDRLVKLLAAAAKTEDLLKVEAELSRVTESIETMKGKKRYLESQVAMSTVRVVFNSPVPQNAGDKGRLPFKWVEELGDGVVTGRAEGRVREASWWDRGVKLELPKSFVRYYVEEDRTEAMSAANVLVKVQRHDNYDKGSLAFWSELARKALVERGALEVTEQREAKLASGAPAVLFWGRKGGGGKDASEIYLLVLAANEKQVVTFEAWGPAAEVEKEKAALEKAGLSVGLKR